MRWGPCVRPYAEAWDQDAFRTLLDAMVAEFVKRRHWILRVVPYVYETDAEAVMARRILEEMGFKREPNGRCYRTFLVDLNTPSETIRKRLDGKWRNQLNAAERNHLEVVEGTDVEMFHHFVTLYDEMMARKRFETSVNVRQFARMQERLMPHERMRVVLARRNGVWHAGVVASRVGQIGIYLLGATAQDGLKSKASYLLQWRTMEFLKSVGCRMYDLGGIDPEANPGVFHFKAGMGGVESRLLGTFEYAPSVVQKRLLHWLERFQRWWRRRVA
ncbi:MAG: peptidoglycan bridge formation glycyltransferase FemA/FemB family protein [Verrucomicrobiota bacterium]|nr:peptidoglycan bridge formation glycyltransferase FemA/FemB family protein [Limisphaera sp.]MDW8380822.1 peptidoglycan bridge formation glycyltransferase FemA/FemB family protein [Verrucomicrobiota bacterium]